jgi:Sec-independent protein translocase protein TatA
MTAYIINNKKEVSKLKQNLKGQVMLMAEFNEELINEKFKNINEKDSEQDERLSKIENKVIEMDKTFNVIFEGINQSLKQLSILPQVMSEATKATNEMRISMGQMQIELQNNTQEIKEVKADVKEQIGNIKQDVKQIDNDSSFKITLWARQNIGKILAGGTIVIAVGGYILYKLFA